MPPPTAAASAEQAVGHPAGNGGQAVVCSDFTALPDDVARLLDGCGSVDIQASRGWYVNFVQNVDLQGAQPRLYAWREGGQAVVALALLVQRDAGGRGATVSSLGNYYTTRWSPQSVAIGDGADAADATTSTAQAASQFTARLAALIAEVLRLEAPVHTLRLQPLAGGSAAEAALRAALRRNGLAVYSYGCFQNWLLPVATDWPTYLRGRDGALRTTLSRMGKRFAAKGGRLTLVQGGPDLEPAIAAYVAVYAASWKQPEPHPQFMPGLIRTAAGQGQLRMALAWLVDKPVAAQVWMVAGGRADIYKLAHDEAHKETSPGTLLTALLMQHVFEVDHVTVVDYLSGNDAYKKLWMTEVREQRGLLAYRLASLRGLRGALRETLAAARRALQRRWGATPRTTT